MSGGLERAHRSHTTRQRRGARVGRASHDLLGCPESYAAVGRASSHSRCCLLPSLLLAASEAVRIPYHC